MVASVLHLGNVRFGSDSTGQAVLSNNAELRRVSNVRKKPGHSEVSGYFMPFASFFPAAPGSGRSQSPGGADVPKDRGQD